MRITYKGDYALKTILNLALHYGEPAVAINDLARRADISTKFLEQILLDLKRGGFVQSRRGKIGGYLLARHPSRIRLGEVIEFIDGPIEPIACVDKGYAGCNDKDKCVFRGIWRQVTDGTARIVNNITFEDLAKRCRKSNLALVYQI